MPLSLTERMEREMGDVSGQAAVTQEEGFTCWQKTERRMASESADFIKDTRVKNTQMM